MFELPYMSFLQVHMSQELTKRGNQLMYKIRTEQGGLTIAMDNVVDDASNNTSYTITLPDGMSSQGQTPPPSPHPEIEDWDKVDLP